MAGLQKDVDRWVVNLWLIGHGGLESPPRAIGVDLLWPQMVGSRSVCHPTQSQIDTANKMQRLMRKALTNPRRRQFAKGKCLSRRATETLQQLQFRDPSVFRSWKG